ncbi:MAG: SAF domain-containing protein [Actinomycetia bacterium]|nr:SAF domain-containing protein [Actinomycetes bacterium]
MLRTLLADRDNARRPLRVGLVGAGVFGTMFLSQARRLAGLHVLGIADLDLAGARARLERAGWPAAQIAAPSAQAAVDSGATWLTEDADALIDAPGLEVLVEATGSPAAALRHSVRAFERGVHVVNVTVEADALLGPVLGERSAAAGVVYSYAYGDQPALVCELVDWAWACGLEVVCAGKGTKYLPAYHASTPDTVWDSYGIEVARAAAEGLNATMFNSFLDGTKSAIEMAAVANATGLHPQAGGLGFPPCAVEELAATCIPLAAGGVLERDGTVEVPSSLARDGTELANDLRWGVYVVFEASSPYVSARFGEYGLHTDPSGRYGALWRPFHLVGLELTAGVLRAGLRNEATGVPIHHLADVTAVAKTDLRAGRVLDGEGGFCAWGRLRPAAEAVRNGELPIGLTDGLRLRRDVARGAVVTYTDVELDETDETLAVRRELERRIV